MLSTQHYFIRCSVDSGFKKVSEPSDSIVLISKLRIKLFLLGKPLEVDENGSRFSKRVENTLGKGEIARYEQFLLFPLCFPKTCTADM